MRLFAAIELPDDARRHLFDVAKEVRRRLEAIGKVPPVSWTKESNLHVTLKFLGDVPDAQVPAVIDALKEVRQGPPALRLFTHRLNGFPSKDAARVIVARVLGDVDRLIALHATIEEQCAAIGFAKENRRYQPHVTIGRPREALRGVWDVIEGATIDRFPGLEFEADSFSLVQSKLNPGGAIYSTVATFPAFA
jgi:RNA 2',3'-cyclic 3'-phosphodiesterase